MKLNLKPEFAIRSRIFCSLWFALMKNLEIISLIYLEYFGDGDFFEVELFPVTLTGTAASSEQQLNPNIQIPLLWYPHGWQLISSWLTFKLFEQSGVCDRLPDPRYVYTVISWDAVASYSNIHSSDWQLSLSHTFNEDSLKTDPLS